MPYARAQVTTTAGVLGGALANAIKTVYKDGIPTLEQAAGPFWERLRKVTDWVGMPKSISFQHGLPQGSNTFTTAQSNASAGRYFKVQVNTTNTYVPVYLDRKTIKLTRNDTGALIRSVKRTIDGGIQSCVLNLAVECFRDGTGIRGTLDTALYAGGPPVVVTLATPSDSANVHLDMVIVDAANPTVNIARITKINRKTGALTLSVSAGGFSAVTNVARQGDTESVSGYRDNALLGLAAWLPYTAPTTTETFFQADRSVDPEMLAGGRYDISTYSKLEEGISDAALELKTHGGPPPDVCILNPVRYGSLIKSLGTKVQRDQNDARAKFLFRGVDVYTDAGTIEVVPDLRCPVSRGYLLRMDTWELGSAGPCPEIFDDDGQMLREASADSYEVRIGGYPQLVCDAPGWNMVLNV